VSVAPHERDDWDQHWAEYAGSAAENPAQEFRRRLILRLLQGVSASSRVVDIGSGTGDLAASLREAYPRTSLLGLELSRIGVELAQRRVPDATFLQADLSTGAPPPPEYRAWATHAVCSEVLEHVDDPGDLMANCRPYLAPGCLLVVTVPGGPMTEYDRHIGHRRHFDPETLSTLLEREGFEVSTSTGAGYPVFNVYRLLMRALGSRLVSIAGSAEPSASSRLAMRGFAVGMRANSRLSKRGWQIVAVARHGPAEPLPP
jgi:trans-aconitate methyltransferase